MKLKNSRKPDHQLYKMVSEEHFNLKLANLFLMIKCFLPQICEVRCCIYRGNYFPVDYRESA